MHLYLSRGGSIEGPFPVEQVKSMLEAGEWTPADLGAIPGDSDWKPLSELIDCSGDAPAPPSGPPPMPVQAEPAWDAPFSIEGHALSGTRGKTVRNVAEEAASGGRFVIYPYVFSLLILSFRRNSPITYIPPGRSGAGPAIGWSLVSMTVGWWGIPWGIIFTIGALWRNAAGGIDVTEPVLAQSIGPERADALLRQQPKRPAGGLWLARAVILSPLILIGLLVVSLFASAARSNSDQEKMPGYGEFKQANQTISRDSETEGHGNTPTAVAAGRQFATLMDAWLDDATTEDRTDASTGGRKNISVWCELHAGRCLFLVKIPDLRKFNGEDKDEIGQAAWYAAQISAHELGLTPDDEVAVAVRGLALYDRLITGSFVAELDLAADVDATLKKAIRKTDLRISGGERLAGYFVPPDA